jgi:hypothetical protein
LHHFNQPAQRLVTGLLANVLQCGSGADRAGGVGWRGDERLPDNEGFLAAMRTELRFIHPVSFKYIPAMLAFGVRNHNLKTLSQSAWFNWRMAGRQQEQRRASVTNVTSVMLAPDTFRRIIVHPKLNRAQSCQKTGEKSVTTPF